MDLLISEQMQQIELFEQQLQQISYDDAIIPSNLPFTTDTMVATHVVDASTTKTKLIAGKKSTEAKSNIRTTTTANPSTIGIYSIPSLHNNVAEQLPDGDDHHDHHRADNNSNTDVSDLYLLLSEQRQQNQLQMQQIELLQQQKQQLEQQLQQQQRQLEQQQQIQQQHRVVVLPSYVDGSCIPGSDESMILMGMMNHHSNNNNNNVPYLPQYHHLKPHAFFDSDPSSSRNDQYNNHRIITGNSDTHDINDYHNSYIRIINNVMEDSPPDVPKS